VLPSGLVEMAEESVPQGLKPGSYWAMRPEAEASGYLEATATAKARSVVERFEQCAGESLVAGPSTALRSAQDDKVLGDMNFWKNEQQQEQRPGAEAPLGATVIQGPEGPCSLR